MISLKDAVEIAENYLKRQKDPDIIIANMNYFHNGWIFNFNSKIYMDTGDDMYYPLGGHSLYIAWDSGEVIKIPSSYDNEVYLRDVIGLGR